ncbi:alpha/beta hydrolase [Panacibacter ginsenosidivorans]|uniref:Alpha/beta hydrolase n=1 Tax=Panacibacter ginsenosidivorans TaxID=1813871 RepID=A0A5B8V9S4_9BACT|nr:alpha/beta fold hydrolase [Panacibacter ginsenosidivorans]QEC67673.1 alpha/beta hydrolase [Panacibacter ginsenosidivorans]
MQHLLLLHGAFGAKDQFEPLTEKLKDDFIIHTLNFSAHGGTPIPGTSLSIELYAKDVLHYMLTQNIEQANIFGYSMGGYVAMYIAKHAADKVKKNVTLASKFHWDETIAAKEVKMLDAAAIELKVPAFAQQLAARHAPSDWKLLLQKTAEMMMNLGRNNTLSINDYNSIATSSLLMLGDRDKMVTLEETIAVYKNLPNAQLSVLPNTSHPIEQVDTDMLSYIIRNFLLH